MAGLYLHVPFCEHKCIYCNFYSIESLDGRRAFLDAIVREIDLRAEALLDDPDAPSSYESVFIGGGTPSLLSPEELGAVVERLGRRFRIAPGAEFTVECNPGTLNAEWLQGYRALGINRLSFGVQSFHDDELRFLTRIHTAEQARRSVAAARAVFDNVSIDLIFALPDQTVERWRRNLRSAVELGTGHISAYSLIFEEGTPLNAMRLHGDVAPAAESAEADMYEDTVATLAAHGFEQYEVSNYAQRGRACRHNLGYWERRTYISFGPSAHSFLRHGTTGVRWANASNLSAYLEAIDAGRLPVVSREEVTPTMALEESVMLGLRSRGIMLDEFEAIAGRPLEQLAGSVVERIVAGGYGAFGDGRLTLGPRGYIFADRFALDIIDAAERSLRPLATRA